MVLAQIVIDNNCPPWWPVWLCLLGLGPGAIVAFTIVFVVPAVSAALIWWDLTHPIGGKR